MRTASAHASGQFGKRPLLALGTLVVGAFAAYEFAQYVINDNLTGLGFAVMCVVGGAIVVAILNNWRNGMYFFLGWLLFGEFARSIFVLPYTSCEVRCGKV